MFANRYTALVDACSLASVMRRNLLLSLAEAEFFRLRWSERILDETQAAIDTMAEHKGLADHAGRAARARRAMQTAFEDAMVTDYAHYLPLADGLPDPDDAHVVAAALKTQAQTIITENLRDFPADLLDPLGIEARSADDFIADTIALDPGRAIPAIKRMRLRFRNPAMTAATLLIDMEAHSLLATVDTLAPFSGSL